MGLLQCLMFVFNFIFWIIGGTLLGIGIWLAVDPNAAKMLEIASSAGMDDNVWAAAVYTTIGIGAFVTLVGFLGCWGALGRGKKWALYLYTALVTVILVIQFVILILAIVFHSAWTEAAKEGMRNDVQTKYGIPTEITLTNAWNSMQQEWKCCGSYNYTDYKSSNYSKIEGGNATFYVVPITCCTGAGNNGTISKHEYDQCKKEANGETMAEYKYPILHQQGCYDGLRNFLKTHSTVLIVLICIFLALEVFGLVLACCLVNRSDGGGGGPGRSATV